MSQFTKSFVKDIQYISQSVLYYHVRQESWEMFSLFYQLELIQRALNFRRGPVYSLHPH